jgi:hypothetical protein
MASSAAMYQINTRTIYFPQAVNITLDYVAKANINKANSDWNTTVQYNLDKVDKLTAHHFIFGLFSMVLKNNRGLQQ